MPVIHPGASKNRLLAAIQLLSQNISAEKVYTHVGWLIHGGEYIYLHADGAIGKDGVVPGVRVDLPEQLTCYKLPPPPEGATLRDAVHASLRVLDVAPDTATIPLSAGIYRSVVGATDFGLAPRGRQRLR